MGVSSESQRSVDDGLRPVRRASGFEGSTLRSSDRRARQAVIQLRKRSRVDLAPVLGVRPFLMAKTVGTFLAAEARRFAAGAQDADPHGVAEVLLGDSTIARLADGSWGYEFDVQTRWAFYPAGSANLIATYFCARGLGEAGLVLRRAGMARPHAQKCRLRR